MEKNITDSLTWKSVSTMPTLSPKTSVWVATSSITTAFMVLKPHQTAIIRALKSDRLSLLATTVQVAVPSSSASAMNMEL